MAPTVIPYSWSVLYYMYDYLFQQIIESKWIPDTILMVLRGGAFVGSALYERFREIKGQDISYSAIILSSYTPENEQSRIKYSGCTLKEGELCQGKKVLITDDIFDTGATARFIGQYLEAAHSSSIDARLAVLDYKVKKYLPPSKGVIAPDYYARKFEIESAAEDVWIEYPFFKRIT